MKIINKTKWDTNDLRKVCLRVIKHIGSENKNHQITIVTKHRRLWMSNYGGVASINGSWITMKVPSLTKIKVNTIYSPTEKTIGSNGKEYPKIIEFQKIPEKVIFDVRLFSQILEHEIAHNLGLKKHKDMMPYWESNVDYVNDLSVRPKESKPKQKRNLIQERHNKALKKIKALNTKLKRTKTILKRWEKKVKYYEKVTLSKQ